MYGFVFSVVHLSSRASTMALGKCSDSLKAKLTNLKTIDEVTAMITLFVQ